MADSGRTTFIPQGASVSPAPRKRRTFGVFTVLSVLIFLLSLAGLGGAILYEQQLERDIAQLDDVIERSEDAFNRPLLEEIARLDRKIEASREILAGHTSLQELFVLIDANTLHNIRFTAFGFDTSSDGEYTLTLQGIGRDYSAIALQSDAFVQTRRLDDVVFDNLRLTSDGTVTFTMQARVDAGLLDYELTI